MWTATYIAQRCIMFRQYQMGTPDSTGPLAAAYLAYWLSPPLLKSRFGEDV